jgi:PAS domain S-box-containing protein
MVDDDTPELGPREPRPREPRPHEPRPQSFDATAAAEEQTPVSETLRRMVADLVLETTTEGIWLIDSDARTTFVNPRLARLLGYTAEEMIGESIFTFIDRERWPVAERNLKQRELGIEDRQEVQLVRKDGTRVWVLGSANPVFDRNGEYAGALAIIGDLTLQKDREHQLQSQLDDLRNRPAAQPLRPALATETPAPYREPFRTAIVVATYGALLATIAIVTTGAVVGALFGTKSRPPES